MKELAQVKEEIKSILDSHNDNLSSMFNIHNAKLSKAKEGVEIGKYQRAYYDGLLNNAKDDMKHMYQGYRETLLSDLNKYKSTIDRAIRKLPKDINYQKAIYELQYLKSIEPIGEDQDSQDMYNREVYRIATETPHLASNVLNACPNVSNDTKQKVKDTADILLGNDLVLYIDDVIKEVSSTISAKREQEGLYTLKKSIALDTQAPKSDTFEILSFE